MVSLRGTVCFHISTINSVMQKHECFKFFSLHSKELIFMSLALSLFTSGL